MNRCGNRAKAAGFRRRHKAEVGTEVGTVDA
jgi:hypothetical protein